MALRCVETMVYLVDSAGDIDGRARRDLIQMIVHLHETKLVCNYFY